MVLAQALSPLGLAGRNEPPAYTQLTPLVTLADALQAESATARRLGGLVAELTEEDKAGHLAVGHPGLRETRRLLVTAF